MLPFDITISLKYQSHFYLSFPVIIKSISFSLHRTFVLCYNVLCGFASFIFSLTGFVKPCEKYKTRESTHTEKPVFIKVCQEFNNKLYQVMKPLNYVFAQLEVVEI